MGWCKITAVVRRMVLETVEQRLQAIGVPGITVSHVKGYGEYKDFYARDWSITRASRSSADARQRFWHERRPRAEPRRSPQAVTGSSIRATVPRPNSLSSFSVPPCCSAIHRAIERPRPVPPGSRTRARSPR